jgi:hypothetical protein
MGDFARPQPVLRLWEEHGLLSRRFEIRLEALVGGLIDKEADPPVIKAHLTVMDRPKITRAGASPSLRYDFAPIYLA